MAKPSSDPQLEQRVADLEARMTTAEADILMMLDAGASLEARVTTLEGGETTEPPPEEIIEPPEEIIDPPEEITEPPPVTGERTPLTATITYDGAVVVISEAGAIDIGNYVDPAGAFTQRCLAFTSTELRDFTVHFRPDVAGDREEVVFELGSAATGNSPYSMLEYRATIKQGDTTLYETTIKNQHYRTRWRWQSAPRPVRTEIAGLIASGKLPPYTEDLATQCPPSQVHVYEPMGFAGVTKAMGGTGDRPDIGPVTECQADYICTGRNLATVLAQAEACGSFPWHYRDAATGAPLDSYVALNASSYNSSNPNPYLATQWALNGDNPDKLDNIQCDVAHHPALAYLPFLLTGDPYYLEEQQHIVVYCITAQPWNGRMWNIYMAIRAHAWAARSAASAVMITPETVPSWLLPRAWFQTHLDDNRDWMLATYLGQSTRKAPPVVAPEALEAYGLNWLIGVDPHAAEGAAVAWQRFMTTEQSFGDNDESPQAPQGTYSQTYMSEFEAFIFCWLVLQGHEDWRPIAEWKIRNTIARTNGTSGWCRAISTPYRQILRPARDLPWCADWKASWDLTAARYNFVITDPDVIAVSGNDISYYTYSEAALAMALRIGIEDARASHTWIHSQIDNLVAASAGRSRARRWCVAAG